MKVLIIWICATAAMDNCEVHRLSNEITQKQCQALSQVYYETLNNADNYRIECEDAGEQN